MIQKHVEQQTSNPGREYCLFGINDFVEELPSKEFIVAYSIYTACRIYSNIILKSDA